MQEIYDPFDSSGIFAGNLAEPYFYLSETSFLAHSKGVDRIVEVVNALGSHLTVLSDGMGRGDLELELVRAGHWVAGIDLSMKNARIALWRRARSFIDEAEEKFHVVVADAHALPFQEGDENRGFDLVIINEAYGHLDPEKALPEAKRVLRANGKLLITYYPPGKEAPPYYKVNEKDEIIAELEKSGFAIEDEGEIYQDRLLYLVASLAPEDEQTRPQTQTALDGGEHRLPWENAHLTLQFDLSGEGVLLAVDHPAIQHQERYFIPADVFMTMKQKLQEDPQYHVPAFGVDVDGEKTALTGVQDFAMAKILTKIIYFLVLYERSITDGKETGMKKYLFSADLDVAYGQDEIRVAFAQDVVAFDVKTGATRVEGEGDLRTYQEIVTPLFAVLPQLINPQTRAETLKGIEAAGGSANYLRGLSSRDGANRSAAQNEETKRRTMEAYDFRAGILDDPDIYYAPDAAISFARRLSLEPGDWFLEMGSGGGGLSIYMARRGVNVVAVDIDPKAVQLLKKTVAKNRHLLQGKIDVRQGDLFASIRRGEKFRAITFYAPFMNIPFGEPKKRIVYDPGFQTIAGFLREAGNHLTDDGEVLLIYPSDDEAEGRVRRFAAEGNLKIKSIGIFEEVDSGFFIYMLVKEEAHSSVAAQDGATRRLTEGFLNPAPLFRGIHAAEILTQNP
ncbi:MAG: class I SAM-dependent methyltransferase [Candidatus Omnitrophota bacterium]